MKNIGRHASGNPMIRATATRHGVHVVRLRGDRTGIAMRTAPHPDEHAPREPRRIFRAALQHTVLPPSFHLPLPCI